MSQKKKRRRFQILLLLSSGFGLVAAGLYYVFGICGYALTPGRAKFVYGDLERLHHALERVRTEGLDLRETLEAEYLGRGSRGLRTYAKIYGVSPDSLATAILERPDDYRELDDLLRRLRAVEPDIRQAYTKLERLYGRAIFPPTYYLAGPGRAAGANKAVGIMVAAELYRLGDTEARSAGPPDRWPSSRVSHLVVHELIHFNSVVASRGAYMRDWTNLARAIKEGAADFLAEWVSGSHINPRAHRYGLEHEHELWKAFQLAADSHDTGEWFFSDPEGGQPPDLGYFLGYRIVQSYYDRAADKHRAIHGILSASDYRAFLAASGYSPQTP